jgi:hypothetical protein
MGSSSSVINHNRRKKAGTKFLSAGEIQEQKLQIQKLFWLRFPMKVLGLGIII